MEWATSAAQPVNAAIETGNGLGAGQNGTGSALHQICSFASLDGNHNVNASTEVLNPSDSHATQFVQTGMDVPPQADAPLAPEHPVNETHDDEGGPNDCDCMCHNMSTEWLYANDGGVNDHALDGGYSGPVVMATGAGQIVWGLENDSHLMPDEREQLEDEAAEQTDWLHDSEAEGYEDAGVTVIWLDEIYWDGDHSDAEVEAAIQEALRQHREANLAARQFDPSAGQAFGSGTGCCDCYSDAGSTSPGMPGGTGEDPGDPFCPTSMAPATMGQSRRYERPGRSSRTVKPSSLPAGPKPLAVPVPSPTMTLTGVG